MGEWVVDELLKSLVASISKGEINGAVLDLEPGKRLVIQVETAEAVRPFKCPHCTRRAKSRRGMTKHIHTRHPGKSATSQQAS